MATDKIEGAKDEINNYASRHPRRMWGSAFLMGTAIGASLMAAKKNNQKNGLQKFLDQFSH